MISHQIDVYKNLAILRQIKRKSINVSFPDLLIKIIWQIITFKFFLSLYHLKEIVCATKKVLVCHNIFKGLFILNPLHYNVHILSYLLHNVSS